MTNDKSETRRTGSKEVEATKFEQLVRKPVDVNDLTFVQNTTGQRLILDDLGLSDDPDRRGIYLEVDEIIDLSTFPKEARERSSALRNAFEMKSTMHDGFKCLTVVEQGKPAVESEEPMVTKDVDTGEVTVRADVPTSSPITLEPNIYDEKYDQSLQAEEDANKRIIERSTTVSRRGKASRRTQTSA